MDMHFNGQIFQICPYQEKAFVELYEINFSKISVSWQILDSSKLNSNALGFLQK